MSGKLLSTTPSNEKQSTRPGYGGRPITETITNGLFTVDNKWTVIYWNKAAEKILGVLSENIVGKNLWEELAGVIPVDFYTVYHKAFIEDIPLQFQEYWGEKGIWLDVITWYNGGILSVSFKSSDMGFYVEDRQPPLQKLAMLNELYKYVTEVTNDCLWEWDIEAREIFWIDGGHKRVFGYQIENALIPQSFWENRIHPEDRQRVLEKLKRLIADATESAWEEEYRFRKADGEYAYVCDRGHIVYRNDKVSRMIGATQDISSRKLTEMKLSESERKLTLIARQTLNAILITDAEGKITWVNNGFTRITEYEQEEVLGRKPGEFLQGKETDPATVDYLRQRIADKLPFTCDIINYTKSGRKYWMHIQGQCLLNEKGDHDRFFAIQTDITERILLEEKLSMEIAERQKKITAAVIGAQERERADIGRELHDNLNQVLAVAKLYVQMADTYDEKKGKFLEKAAGCIMEVIEEIRKIAKTLTDPTANFLGLYESIQGLLHDLLATHPIKFRFLKNLTDEKSIDAALQLNIFRIVQEQVNNILKHSGASMATINLGQQDRELLLVISDNGQGCDMSSDKTGVGIVNIRSRVELYGGTAIVVSTPGHGYELRVQMPMDGPATGTIQIENVTKRHPNR